MDIESLGGGAGTGIIGAILVAFGFSRRVSKLEDGKLNKDVFVEFRKNVDDKFNTIIEGQSKIWDRLDSLNDYVRNK